MKVSFVSILLLLGLNGFTQGLPDTVAAGLRALPTPNGDSIHLSAILRPLRQTVGAPPAFYTYFWEMGDGRFSFDKEPVYAYRDTGTYTIRLYATNNYDDGKAPPTRPHPIKIRKKILTKDAWASHFFHGGGDIEMKINRYPKPGEDFVTIIGYRNQSRDSLSGSIVLFYNERQLGHEGFSLAEQRFYHHEDSTGLHTLMAQVDRNAMEEALAFEPRGHGTRVGEDAAADRTNVAGEVSRDAYSRSVESTVAGEDAAADRTNVAGEVSRDVYSGSAESTTEVPVPSFAGETQSMLHSLENTYSRHTVLHFHSIPTGTEQFVFMDMNTLPGMLQDTNATVGISAMLVPDDPTSPPQLFALDMQVVSSHDPNRMLLRSRRINYRFFRQKKELLYRVEFQNTGRGPAHQIKIGLSIPRQLNPETIRVNAIRPVCKWCDSAYQSQSCIDTIRRGDSLYFIFNNIYLPGLMQEGVGDKDSTSGFVEYAIRFKKKPKKIPFSTQAAIAFDRQTPVLTNKANAKFIKGLSPGIMAGYSVLPGNGGYGAKGPLQFGYVLSPYAPDRPYFQVEAFVGLLQQDAFTSTVVKTNNDTLIGGLPFVVTGHQTKTTVNRNSFEITPLHFRYNIGKYIGVGVGAMAQINISEQTTTENKAYFVTNLLPLNVHEAVTTTKSAVTYLGSWNAAPFFDLQLGAVRHGPVIGARYIRLLKGDLTNRFFLYAGFKL